jgi:hypothetical protein
MADDAVTATQRRARRPARGSTYENPLATAPASAAHTDRSHERRKSLHRSGPGPADTISMNDFHIALLWLRSLEIVIGHSPVLMLSELEMHDLFVRYRSPYKA